MRFACSLGPALAELASVSSSTEPVTAAWRARPPTTCAVLVLTFMALVNSLNSPMRAPDYTVRSAPPRMSQSTDVAGSRQFVRLLLRTAQCAANGSPVTAGVRPNDYLVARSPVHPQVL